MVPINHSSGLHQSRVVIARLPHYHRTRACISLRRQLSHPNLRSHPSQLRHRLQFLHQRNVGRRPHGSHRLLHRLCRPRTSPLLPNHRRTPQRHTSVNYKRNSVPVLVRVRVRRKLHRPQSLLAPPREPMRPTQNMGNPHFRNDNPSLHSPLLSPVKLNLGHNLEARGRTRWRRMMWLPFRLHPHLVLMAAMIMERFITHSPNTPSAIHRLRIKSKDRVSARLRRRLGYRLDHRRQPRFTTTHPQVQRARNHLRSLGKIRVTR